MKWRSKNLYTIWGAENFFWFIFLGEKCVEKISANLGGVGCTTLLTWRGITSFHHLSNRQKRVINWIYVITEINDSNSHVILRKIWNYYLMFSLRFTHLFFLIINQKSFKIIWLYSLFCNFTFFFFFTLQKSFTRYNN